MENFRELTEKQIRFLRDYGLEPNDFLSVNTSAESYTFYHINSRKEVSLRR